MGIEIGLLGAVTVRVGGEVVDAGHARQRCVLACLALEANRPVPVEQVLLDRVWADHPPRHARSAVAGYVSRLRRVLSGIGEVAIQWQAEGYLLAVDPIAVDVHRFHDLTARARACTEVDEACELYRRALTLWRGEACAGMDTPWLNQIRASLEAQRLAAELDYYELALGQGAHSELVAVLSDQVQAHPLDERLAGQLLLALYRCGRQADALEHYEQVRVRLAEELGADPGPALQKRYAAILRQDSGLDLPARTAPDNLAISLSSFIGRSSELAELRSELAAGRLCPSGSVLEEDRDPVVRAILDHIAGEGPLRSGEQVDLVRFRAEARKHQRDSYAMPAANVSHLIEVVTRRQAGTIYLYIDAKHVAASIDYLAYLPLVEVDFGGLRHVATGIDWRRLLVDFHIELMRERARSSETGQSPGPPLPLSTYRRYLIKALEQLTDLLGTVETAACAHPHGQAAL